MSVEDVETYAEELRAAGDDPARLKMCAQGAIAHARMIETDREESRLILEGLALLADAVVGDRFEVAAWVARARAAVR